MGTEFVETAVIGGGQQGCSVAGSLARLGYQAVVFERGETGQTWARERWESLRVNTPNRTVTFPGMPYDGDDPEGYMPAREVALLLRRYVAETGVEVREHTAVRAVEAPVEDPSRQDARFRLHLENGDTVESRNVVAALGGYSSPRLPELTARIDPSVTQLHTRYYRDPQSLPPGAVLVVGSGNSGQQIAEDLRDAGRQVYLAVGRHKTSPRRYRGAQVLDWLQLLPLEGNLESASGGRGDSAVLPGVSVLSGKAGGQDLSLTVLAGKGVTLVGTVRGAHGGTLLLEDNVRAIAQAAAARRPNSSRPSTRRSNSTASSSPSEPPYPPSTPRCSRTTETSWTWPPTTSPRSSGPQDSCPTTGSCPGRHSTTTACRCTAWGPAPCRGCTTRGCPKAGP